MNNKLRGFKNIFNFLGGMGGGNTSAQFLFSSAICCFNLLLTFCVELRSGRDASPVGKESALYWLVGWDGGKACLLCESASRRKCKRDIWLNLEIVPNEACLPYMPRKENRYQEWIRDGWKKPGECKIFPQGHSSIGMVFAFSLKTDQS